MVDCRLFYEACLTRGISFYTGVPDSTLQDFCACIADHSLPNSHIVAANEGGAVALATGNYLATGKPALVYMQNSGQGNAVNPLISLADTGVYGIPMILLIGWRGEPGFRDEPQHKKQGEVTTSLLETMQIPYSVMPEDSDEAVGVLDGMIARSLSDDCPVAIIVRKGSFEKYERRSGYISPYMITRESAIDKILDCIPPNAFIVSTTGKISRELYELRKLRNEGHEKDFLTVGSMGHASQIALGIAINLPENIVYCLDGDGAVLMHMGSLAISGQSGCNNFRHIVLNNGSHDSVGGQPTVGFSVDFLSIAKACGYSYATSEYMINDIEKALLEIQDVRGPAFLEIRVASGARRDLGRPKNAPINNKLSFMKKIRSITR